ncbi:MAG: response regulator [Alcanivoracaceae bacterium]|nr:response regulator [Alcanivoracaceae bacterium]
MTRAKILVVDDQKTDRMLLEDILNDKGYRVLTAASGPEGLEMAEGEAPDLIFMDVVMDDMDGFKACRLLTKGEKTKDIPVVMVSSNNQKVDKLWAHKQGARAYIIKPYTVDQIMEQIQKFV